MDKRARIPRRPRRTIILSLDRLESRQLLSAAPIHFHAEPLHHHRAAVVENGRHAHHKSARNPAVAATPAAATGGFSVVQSPSAPNAFLTATAAIADNDIWAVGYDDVQVAPPAFDSPLAMHFDGTSWSVVPTPTLSSGGVNAPEAQLHGVGGVSSNDVWAVGFQTGPDNPDFGEQLIEHWNGTAWSVVTGPENEGAGLDHVAAISANNVWAFGAGGGSGLLVEHWDGKSWRIVPDTGILASLNNGIGAVSVDSANNIWALAGTSTMGEILVEFNGTTWSQVAAMPTINGEHMNAGAITAISPTDVWIAGSGFFTSVVVRTPHSYRIVTIDHQAVAQWNGTSWSVVPTPTPDPGQTVNTSFHGIAAASANDIVAIGAIGPNLIDSQTLVEQWNGTTWSIVSSPSPSTTENYLEALTALSDGTVVAVGTQRDNNGVNIPLILEN
jgi:hypothetical protein